MQLSATEVPAPTATESSPPMITLAVELAEARVRVCEEVMLTIPLTLPSFSYHSASISDSPALQAEGRDILVIAMTDIARVFPGSPTQPRCHIPFSLILNPQRTQVRLLMTEHM